MKVYYLVGILTGIITASIGGLFRNIIALGNKPPEWASFGVVLLPGACWLVPIIGGLEGWLGPLIASKILSSRTETSPLEHRTIEQFMKREREQRKLTIIGFLSGFLGGLVTTMIFIPILLYD